MTTSLLKLAADFDTQLATASSIGATTATLVSATDDDGNALPTGLYGLTIDAGNSSKEYIICTLTSTALTGILSVTRQGVTSSGFARTHRRGAKVTLTDWAILKRMLNNLDGTTGFDSASPLSYDGNPTFTADGQIITKKYADDLAIAGSPDASTTVKGISKLSSAPASPTEPIAVGTNDTRVPTQDENDALAGTSGTPSSSNKYVTNDDTATAATASKVARRLAGGNITVVTETQGNNSTNAASTAYVDAGLANIPSLDLYGIHTVPTSNTWFTWTSNFNMTLISGPSYYPSGWVKDGTIGNPSNDTGGGGIYTLDFSGDAYVAAGLIGNGSSDNYTAADNKDIRIKFRAKFAALGGSSYASIGIIDSAGNTLDDDQTSTASSIRLCLNNATLYFVNANGTSNTNTSIAGSVTYNNWNTYEIVFNPGTDIKLYANGSLIATHTTNLPTGSLSLFGIGTSASGTIRISPITFSLEI